MTRQNQDDLSDLYKAVGLPFTIVSVEGTELMAFPYSFEGIYKTEFLKEMVSLLQKNRPEGVMLQETGDFFYLAVTRIDNDAYLVTAPISSTAENANISPLFAEWVVRERLSEFVHIAVSLPGMNNFQLSKIATIAKRLCSGEISDGTAIYQRSGEAVAYQPKQNAVVLTHEERDRRKHMSYEYEQMLIDAVASGDEQALMNILSRPMYGVIGRMSMNSLRQAKYQFICCVYACCRAAIRGGVPAELSFQMSDAYCQRVDGLSSVGEIDMIRERTMLEYCALVRKYQNRKHYSHTTKVCCEYIREHLYDQISIDDLSNLVHLNRRSLSIYFKQDTGKGIPDYINDARLEEARFLLLNTDMALPEISELFHFCNQSYFCKKFREKYGTSPNALRKGFTEDRE